MNFNFVIFMRFCGEFAATALFMCLGCMGSAVNSEDPNYKFISSLTYGLAIIVVMHCFGFISGALANPCVSIACCILGYIPRNTTMLYIIAQCLGAAFGYFCLLQILPQSIIDNNKPAICMVTPMDKLTSEQIFATEFFLTSIVIYGWCAVWDARNTRFLDSVILHMGFLVISCTFAGSQLTGAAMNPIRVLIPALFKGDPTAGIIQIAAELIAGFVVPYSWQFIFMPKHQAINVVNVDSISN